jgi:hypothetical protein
MHHIDGAADYEGVVVSGIVDRVDRSGLCLRSVLPELFSDELRDTPSGSVFASIDDDNFQFLPPRGEL